LSICSFQIKDKLVKGKAKAESYLSALATHVIGSDPTHHEIEAALDVWQIPAVTVSDVFKCCVDVEQ